MGGRAGVPTYQAPAPPRTGLRPGAGRRGGRAPRRRGAPVARGRLPGGRAARRGEPAADVVGHARLEGAHGHLDGVLDRPRLALAVRDDAHALDAEEGRAAVLGVVELAERGGERLALGVEGAREHPHERGGERLVELEQHVPDEAVADDHVDRPAVARAAGDVAPLDVAEEADVGLAEEELVRLLDGGVPLLGLLADGQQPDGRVVAAEQVLGVHGAEPGELHQLLGRAVDVRTRVEHDDRLARGREEGADGGAHEPLVAPEHERRRGHLRAGVAGGDERVGVAGGLHPQADRHRAARLAAHHDRRLVGHGDDVGRVDDRQPAAVLRLRGALAGEQLGERGLDGPRLADELDGVLPRQLRQGEECAGHRGAGGEVAPHRVDRDARHVRRPST